MDHQDKSDIDKNEERRKRVFVGKLPSDFLRITNFGTQYSRKQQIAADAQAALAMEHVFDDFDDERNEIVGTLNVNIAQAKLVKNYGITRMDPYVTMRIGQFVYETQVDMNGGKNPKWNRLIECRLPTGIRTVNVKIYDECSLKVDELIAWAEIVIPPSVFKGEPCDDWFPLSGRQGDRVEGMINLVMNFIPGDEYKSYPYETVYVNVPTGRALSSLYPPPPRFAPTAVIRRRHDYSLEDLKQVEEMFPDMDAEVVRSVFEAKKGDKDLTVNALLQMSG